MAYPEDREDNSTSPLLNDPERRSGEIWDDAAAVAKQAEKEEEAKSSWYLFLLALSIGG